jgi:hypothetical protein
MNLNENLEVSTLPYTGSEPCVYWGKRGFGVRVYPSGTKKFVLSYRASGRKRLLTIGEHPAISLDKAEDMAAAYRLQIDEGGDPVLEKRYSESAANAMPKPQLTAKKTVAALCDAYLTLHASRKLSGRDDERLTNRFVRPAWAQLKASAVTRAHVAMLHAQVAKRTPVQANRLLAVIKTMWNKAITLSRVPMGFAVICQLARRLHNLPQRSLRSAPAARIGQWSMRGQPQSGAPIRHHCSVALTQDAENGRIDFPISLCQRDIAEVGGEAG